MITDLLGSDQRFNVPGAVAESNWSARLPYTVEEFGERGELKKLTAELEGILRETGRGK
jgi:4-alpha-glucanotransferase